MISKAVKEIPQIGGELAEFENGPLVVIQSRAYGELKSSLQSSLEEIPVGQTLQSGEEFRKFQEAVNRWIELEKSILSRFDPIRASVEKAYDDVNAAQGALLNLTGQIRGNLSLFIQQFKEQRDRELREKQELEERHSATQRNKAQREIDLLSLRCEITAARQVADNSERGGHLETAKAIRKELERFGKLESAPGNYTNPGQDANQIRRMVASVLSHETGETG